MSELEPTPSSFKEAFPHIDPNVAIDFWPLKIFDKVLDWVGDAIGKIAAKVVEHQVKALSEAVTKGDYDRVLTNRVLNNSISAITDKPLDTPIQDNVQELFLNSDVQNFIYHSSEAFKAFKGIAEAYPEISFVPVGFIFYRVVKAYADIKYPISLINSESDIARRTVLTLKRGRDIRYFILFGAPFITIGIYSALNPKMWTKANELVRSRLGIPKESLLLLLSLKKKVKLNIRSISSHNTIPPVKESYKYTIIFSVIISYLLLKLSFIIGLKSVLFYYLIALYIYYVYLIIEFIIIIYYIKNNIATPQYIPDFIRRPLVFIESIVKSGDTAIKSLLHIELIGFIAHSLLVVIGTILYFLL